VEGTGYPLPEEYKHGSLELQVRGVLHEAVKYGYGSCASETIESIHCKLQIRPLAREGALNEEEGNCQ
jgi:hypothetical protein